MANEFKCAPILLTLHKDSKFLPPVPFGKTIRGNHSTLSHAPSLAGLCGGVPSSSPRRPGTGILPVPDFYDTYCKNMIIFGWPTAARLSVLIVFAGDFRWVGTFPRLKKQFLEWKNLGKVLFCWWMVCIFEAQKVTWIQPLQIRSTTNPLHIGGCARISKML